jgi:NAD(P)-dependent dehydrogenase (short-subunit alcohol dehydrogenase family)
MDAKVAIIAGYGIGISVAVAKRLGSEGYKLALLARTQTKVNAAAMGKSRKVNTSGPYSNGSDTHPYKSRVYFYLFLIVVIGTLQCTLMQ